MDAKEHEYMQMPTGHTQGNVASDLIRVYSCPFVVKKAEL